MTTPNSTVIVCTFMILLLVACMYFSFLDILKEQLEKRNELKEYELKTERDKYFNSVDIDKIDDIIYKKFLEYVQRYIVFKFVSQKILHIKSSDIDQMVKDITKLAVIDMSELQIYYIKLIRTISSDEDLIKFVNEYVRNIVIDEVRKYNNSEE